MEGVVNEFPDAKEVPPVAFAHQVTVPGLADAVKVREPASHRAFGVVEVTVGLSFI